MFLVCLSDTNLYGQDFLSVWNNFKQEIGKGSYQYTITSSQKSEDSIWAPPNGEKPVTLEYRISPKGVLVVSQNNVIWYGKDKTIMVDDLSKTITIYKTSTQQADKKIVSENMWIDSLIQHNDKIKTTKIDNENNEYTYLFNQLRPLTVRLFYRKGDLFFNRIEFTQVVNSITYTEVQVFSSMSTTIDSRFMSEEYFILTGKNSETVPSLYYPHYKISVLDYEK
jgi:hypothetical protein